jgi:CHAT domain-containing protein/tetratricopeptide (TPR) repeat protein
MQMPCTTFVAWQRQLGPLILSSASSSGPIAARTKTYGTEKRCAKRTWLIIFLALTPFLPCYAQTQSQADQQIIAAIQSVSQGHVLAGLDRLEALQLQIDPQKDDVLYWRAGSTLLELLGEIEDTRRASTVSQALFASKVWTKQPAFRQWLQFYIGRNLFYSRNYDQAQTFLRSLTAEDARRVLTPAQRAGAIILSKIAIQRGEMTQAGIWMRRAVIALSTDNGAGSEEMLDVLTEYAHYLEQSRRLIESYALFVRLAPTYDKYYSHHSPKYLRFQGLFLDTLSEIGDFAAAWPLYNRLKDNASGADLVAPSVQNILFVDKLYQLSLSDHAEAEHQLRQLIDAHSPLLTEPINRVIFAFFAIISGDVELAEHFDLSSEKSDVMTAGYQDILDSYIAARRDKFDTALPLLRAGIEQLLKYQRRFETETAGRSPAFTLEERGILSAILALDVSHAKTVDDLSMMFELGQLLNRDRSKLGLDENVSRRKVKSELQREDIRTRDRLRDLRDRLMSESVETILGRVLPIRSGSVSKYDDASFMSRLEDIEDKILNADEQLGSSQESLASWEDRPIDLSQAQKLLKPSEALIMHNDIDGVGLLTQCIDSNNWTFSLNMPETDQRKQFIIDYKLMMSAMRSSNEPSPVLDASTAGFPFSSSARLFQLFFGGIDSCLKGKTNILLATDPDFFTLPWNALLTASPDENQEFRFREAPWLSRIYAFSLLPSVRSLELLREELPKSRARERFLGIGNPDFRGTEHSVPLLGPLFASRGVANKDAIRALPRLPESEAELRSEASVLGAKDTELLLGAHATEQSLRSRRLDDYRVLSFATHAVVAGEVPGITEPALVLSPMEASEIKDDGLLTANKIANLSLDANLVILSACNTAASDGYAGGRGLSGLADSFFFAGARALAVTQWAVFSNAAQRIGVGLVARSLDHQSSGVAEGLRQAMLDYIANAKEDYLANPRFWGAFVIAGDGSVGPLDSVDDRSTPADLIRLEWERMTPEASDSEILSASGRPGKDSTYYVGIERPPPGEKRAGSFLGTTDGNGNLLIESRDPRLAASGVVVVGNENAVFGYYPGDNKSSPLFRLLDPNGNLIWEHVEDSNRWAMPLDFIKVGTGYMLVSIENSFSNGAEKSSLIFTAVSDVGQVLRQRKYDISINPMSVLSRAIAVNEKGDIVIAIGGSKWETPADPMKTWTNPQTGTMRFCRSPDATQILEIDPRSLDVKADKLLENISVVSLIIKDGHVLAAGQFTSECRSEKRVKVIEMNASYDASVMFQSASINSVEVLDIKAAENGIILLSGIVRTFLPTALMATTMSIEELRNYKGVDPWSESFWDSGEKRGAAFVLALDSHGSVLGDRVFADPRDRSIRALVHETSDRWLAVGSAFGDRGWIAELRVSGQVTRSPAVH